MEKTSASFSKMNLSSAGREEDDVAPAPPPTPAFKCVCGMPLCICEAPAPTPAPAPEVFLTFCASYNNVSAIKHEGTFGFGPCYILERNSTRLGTF